MPGLTFRTAWIEGMCLVNDLWQTRFNICRSPVMLLWTWWYSEEYIMFYQWLSPPAEQSKLLFYDLGAETNRKAVGWQKTWQFLDLYFTYKIADFDLYWLRYGFIGPCGTGLVNRRWDNKFLLCETVKWFSCGCCDASGYTKLWDMAQQKYDKCLTLTV